MYSKVITVLCVFIIDSENEKVNKPFLICKCFFVSAGDPSPVKDKGTWTVSHAR